MKTFGMSLLMAICAISDLAAQGKRTPRIAIVVAHNHQALVASSQPYAGKFSVDEIPLAQYRADPSRREISRAHRTSRFANCRSRP